jgi:hypothetical protein
MAFLIVFGAGTLLLGVAYVISIIVTRSRNEGTANWPKVMGSIKQAYVYRHDRSTSEGTTTTYTPVVGYTYTVEEQEYQAYKRNFLPYDQASLYTKEQAEELCAQYPLEGAIEVYYNPTNHAQAVLEKPKAVAHMAVFWYGLVCMLLGGGMIALGILL